MAVFLTVFFNIEFKKTSIYKVCRLFINGTYQLKNPQFYNCGFFLFGSC